MLYNRARPIQSHSSTRDSVKYPVLLKAVNMTYSLVTHLMKTIQLAGALIADPLGSALLLKDRLITCFFFLQEPKAWFTECCVRRDAVLLAAQSWGVHMQTLTPFHPAAPTIPRHRRRHSIGSPVKLSMPAAHRLGPAIWCAVSGWGRRWLMSLVKQSRSLEAAGLETAPATA